MGQRRRGKRNSTAPDDYFAAGPLEFARFGKLVIGRSRATAEQLKAGHAEMATRLPTVVAEIDTLVARIADRVAGLPPDQLLHRAWWELAGVVTRLGGKDVAEADQVMALRMIDYVQSVIASVTPMEPQAKELSDEDWAKLKDDVRTLFTRLMLDYQMCFTAHRQAQNRSLDMDLEQFRSRAEILWMNVRGKRYQPHERQALLDVLTPHSDVLVRLFGIDAETLVSELDKILARLTLGLQDAIKDLQRFRDDTLERFTNLADATGITDADVLREKVFEDPDFVARREKVSGEIFGLDLFDVEKTTQLPKALRNELAWSPAEEKEFFAPGEFCGWPLRIWPTMKRPFIRLSGRDLCCDMFALFDNFYRVVQRAIFRLAPDYRQTWNDRQKEVSEKLPFIYLERLLPTAEVYRPVYYRWKVGDGPAQWYEADGLVIFDDHLFVIEVKAGAFTYTSPATDLPAHIASLRNLVLNPASQGSRFVDYLESAAEVTIADAEHNEIGRLRRSNMRHITVCAVTLDAFTDLAARPRHLPNVGIDVGQRSVWALSIDDLRVYADLFDNPLVFLHFVEQRMRAAHSDLVDLDDEMDHLGLYVAQNNYSQYAKEVVGSSKHAKLKFHGFRTQIDEYYGAVVQGEAVALPKQEMPRRLSEIIEFLATLTAPHRSELGSYLLDCSGDFREELSTTIEQQLRDNHELGRARPLSTYGDVRLTLFSWSPSAPRQAPAAVEHARTVMIANGESSRPLIELEYSAQDALNDIHWQHVGLAPLSASEMERLRAAAAALRERRILAVRRQRKIGANEPCPCGSGRKYKRCCRP